MESSWKSLSMFFCCFSTPSSPPPTPRQESPPDEFLCPISGCLMADPVDVPTGQTFERACIEACKELNYIPPSLSSSANAFPSFALNPNLAIKDAILHWCDDNGRPHALPVSQEEAHQLVRRLKGTEDDERREDSNQEPPSDATASGSLQSRLPERAADDRPTTSSSPSAADPLEEEILMKLKSAEISEQELALKILLQVTTDSRDRGVSLCTQRIVAAIIPMLQSADSNIQTNATAAIFVFSIIEANRIKIVSWGAVPSLLHVLANGMWQAHANAACAIFRLAMEERNRKAIGDLGAIPPLLEKFCKHFLNRIGRQEAALALYYLSLCPDNLNNLANMGAVPQLLAVATDKRNDEAIALRKYAVMLLDCLAGASKGREDLMDFGAIDVMVRMLKEGEGLDKHCLNVMYRISTHWSSRFKGLAVAAGAEEVLAADKQEWGQDGCAMAREMLKFIRKDSKTSKGKIILKPYKPLLSDIKEVLEEEEDQ